MQRSADWQLEPVAQLGDTLVLRAVIAAEHASLGFESVADDAHPTVSARGRETVNRALEAVEDMPPMGNQNFEGLVVVVAADFTDRHRLLLSVPPSGVPGIAHSGLAPRARARVLFSGINGWPRCRISSKCLARERHADHGPLGSTQPKSRSQGTQVARQHRILTTGASNEA
jgi:hypothetical protein